MRLRVDFSVCDSESSAALSSSRRLLERVRRTINGVDCVEEGVGGATAAAVVGKVLLLLDWFLVSLPRAVRMLGLVVEVCAKRDDSRCSNTVWMESIVATGASTFSSSLLCLSAVWDGRLCRFSEGSREDDSVVFAFPKTEMMKSADTIEGCARSCVCSASKDDNSRWKAMKIFN